MIESVGKKRYILWGLAAAVLSMMALLICFLALRVYPFGDHSVLTNDGYVQYVDYFRYLKKSHVRKCGDWIFLFEIIGRLADCPFRLLSGVSVEFIALCNPDRKN